MGLHNQLSGRCLIFMSSTLYNFTFNSDLGLLDKQFKPQIDSS